MRKLNVQRLLRQRQQQWCLFRQRQRDRREQRKISRTANGNAVRPARQHTDLSGRWANADIAAFMTIAVVVTVIAVVESYSNLLAYFLAHGVRGWRAVIAPGAVDSFIVMGELLIYASLRRSWPKVISSWGLIMAFWGFALSVGGNVWHSASASIADHAVSAIWPVTAVAGMAGVLLIVKLSAASHAQAAASRTAGAVPREPQPVSEARGTVPVARRSSGRASLRRQSIVTPDVHAALIAGLSARQLSSEFPGLGTRGATQPLLSSYRKLALNGHGPQSPEEAAADGE